MNFTKNLFIPGFIFLMSFQTMAQSRFAIGVQGGVSRLSSETIAVSDQLNGFNAIGSEDANVFIFSRYYFLSNWSARFGVGVMGLSTAHQFENSKFGRINNGVNGQFLLSIDRFIPFGSSNWGGLVSLGLNGVYLGESAGEISRITSEEGARIGAHLIPDVNGNVGSIMGHDVEYFTRDSEFLVHLRPEVGIYRKFDRQILSLSFVYGHAIGKPLYKNDYNRISLHQQDFSSKHQFSGSFVAVQVGYEFQF